MFRQRKTRLIWMAICVSALLVVALRIFPIGHRTSPYNRDANIPLTFPRYWVPRELHFVGIMDASERLGFRRDPHFIKTLTRAVSYEMDGHVVQGRAQGYTINPGFNDTTLRTDVLVIQLQKEDGNGLERKLYRYEHADLCFQCTRPKWRLTYVGQAKNQLVFLTNGSLGDDPTYELLAVSLPESHDNIAEIAISGSDTFDRLIAELQMSSGVGTNAELACQERSKSTYAFMSKYFGTDCTK